MVTTQKVTGNVLSVPRHSPNIDTTNSVLKGSFQCSTHNNANFYS
jgi:hypothetical protein